MIHLITMFFHVVVIRSHFSTFNFSVEFVQSWHTANFKYIEIHFFFIYPSFVKLAALRFVMALFSNFELNTKGKFREINNNCLWSKIFQQTWEQLFIHLKNAFLCLLCVCFWSEELCKYETRNYFELKEKKYFMR